MELCSVEGEDLQNQVEGGGHARREVERRRQSERRERNVGRNGVELCSVEGVGRRELSGVVPSEVGEDLARFSVHR